MARLFRESIAGLTRVIGLTGGIASGKSHAREYLNSLGAITIDCDSLAHRAYAKGTPCFHSLTAAFSEDIIGVDGDIDRRRLGARVFGSPAELVKLNSIVWPAVETLVQGELAKLAAARRTAPCAHSEHGAEAAAAASVAADHAAAPAAMVADAKPVVGVIEAALLIEDAVQAGWHERCDELWVIHVPKDEAVRRLHERNGLSEADALARINAQMPVEKRLEHATVAIDASGPKAATRAKLDAAWAAMLARIRAETESGHATPAKLTTESM